jgi:hypothetical protein
VIEEYTIKNAMNPPVSLSKWTITSIILGMTVIIFMWLLVDTLGGPVLPTVMSVIFIPFMFYSFAQDAKRSGINFKDYIRKLSINFYCPECNDKLDHHIKHDHTDGVPLLYTCNKCLVLWHVGSYTFD